MSETCAFSGQAVIYLYDAALRNWGTPPVSGYSRLDMYFNAGAGTYRIIGRAMDNPNNVLINANITKEVVYSKTSDTFHQWQDPRSLYGMNFGSKDGADQFCANFEGVIAQLQAGPGARSSMPVPGAAKPAASGLKLPALGGAKIAASPTPAAKPAAEPAPSKPPAIAPKLAATPVASTGGGPPPPPKGGPPPPPPAPPKPAASAGGGKERKNLLGSIEGFKSGGLKKTVTNDRSEFKAAPAAPAVGRSGPGTLPRSGIPAAPSADGGDDGDARPGLNSASSGGGGGGGGMMAEMMARRNKMAARSAAAPTPTPSEEPAPAPAPTPTPAPVASPFKKPPAVQAASKPAPAVVSKPAAPTPIARAQPSTSNNNMKPPAVLPRTSSNNLQEGTPSTPPTRSPSGSFSGISPQDLAALKEEILAEMRKEMAQLRSDILAAISGMAPAAAPSDEWQ